MESKALFKVCFVAFLSLGRNSWMFEVLPTTYRVRAACVVLVSPSLPATRASTMYVCVHVCSCVRVCGKEFTALVVSHLRSLKAQEAQK